MSQRANQFGVVTKPQFGVSTKHDVGFGIRIRKAGSLRRGDILKHFSGWEEAAIVQRHQIVHFTGLAELDRLVVACNCWNTETPKCTLAYASVLAYSLYIIHSVLLGKNNKKQLPTVFVMVHGSCLAIIIHPGLLTRCGYIAHISYIYE